MGGTGKCDDNVKVTAFSAFVKYCQSLFVMESDIIAPQLSSLVEIGDLDSGLLPVHGKGTCVILMKSVFIDSL